MYTIKIGKYYVRKYKYFLKIDRSLRKNIERVYALMQENPFSPKLKTHKVNSARYGIKYSSRVTGDLRIIWDLDINKNLTILLLDIGGHSGKKKVYV